MNMAQPADWWEACQSGNLNMDEWQRQISKAAASLSVASPTQGSEANTAWSRQSFRPFEDWQREINGDREMPSANFRQEPAITGNTNGNITSTSHLTERLSLDNEWKMKEDDNGEDLPTSNQLYHETLTNRTASRINRGPKSSRLLHGKDENANGHAWITEDAKQSRNAKLQNGGGQRRDRKRMYRITGAFQKVKGMVTGRLAFY
jgi:hypothetical protein